MFSTTYYLELIKDELDLFQKETCQNKKEVIARNIISRAYYTILLHCKYTLDSLETTNQNEGTHERIINLVKNEQTKRYLSLNKELRVQADYYKTLKKELKREIDFIKLDKLIHTVDNLLKFDKEVLNKKY